MIRSHLRWREREKLFTTKRARVKQKLRIALLLRVPLLSIVVCRCSHINSSPKIQFFVVTGQTPITLKQENTSVISHTNKQQTKTQTWEILPRATHPRLTHEETNTRGRRLRWPYVYVRSRCRFQLSQFQFVFQGVFFVF